MTDYEKAAFEQIRNAKTWESVTAYFEYLAHEAGAPDDWKAPGSTWTLETVIQQIEDYYQVELFRRGRE